MFLNADLMQDKHIYCKFTSLAWLLPSQLKPKL